MLRLSAVDEPGNQATREIPFVIRERQLLRTFAVDPALFSPNADDQLDTSSISFETLQDALITVTVYEQGGTVPPAELMDAETVVAAAGTTLVWDGNDSGGVAAPDGFYIVEILAEDPTGLLAPETEILGVTIDTVGPTLTLPQPADAGLYGLPLAVQASATDGHPGSYAITLIHPNGSEQTLREDQGNLVPGTAVTISGVSDGAYELTLAAVDAAENETSLQRAFEIDTTLPVASITSPTAGSVVDTAEGLQLSGLLTSAHPDSYEWLVAPGEQPGEEEFAAVWSGLLDEDGVVEYAWANPGLADGVYTIRLTITDQLGRVGETRIVFTIDTTPPQV
ncbi:MAG: hypothetical protein GY838_19415, partial [bacterium]|nr:hypothetical protein [bacterium]